MLVEREPLRAEAEAFVCLQRRHPLRDVPVNGKRQAQEIIHLLWVVEIELEEAH